MSDKQNTKEKPESETSQVSDAGLSTRDSSTIGTGSSSTTERKQSGTGRRRKTWNKRRFQKYDVCETPFDRGNYGLVYEARDKKTKVRAACKGVRQPKDRSVLMEADLMKQLKHPAVVRLFDVNAGRKHVYFFMEFCEGRTLSKRLSRPLCEQHLVRRFFAQLTGGVMYLHHRRIVHRDLKPANILLSAKDLLAANVKIADFGMARIIEEQKLSQTFTGSPYWMAPEVAMCGGSRSARSTKSSAPTNGSSVREDEERTFGYDHKADVYSMGVILLQMLFGFSQLRSWFHNKDNWRPDRRDTVDSGADDTIIEFDEKNQVLSREEGDSSKRVTAATTQCMQCRSSQLLMPKKDAKAPPLSTFRVSRMAWNLCQLMLEPDPNKRVSIFDVANHPYVKPVLDGMPGYALPAGQNGGSTGLGQPAGEGSSDSEQQPTATITEGKGIPRPVETDREAQSDSAEPASVLDNSTAKPVQADGGPTPPTKNYSHLFATDSDSSDEDTEDSDVVGISPSVSSVPGGLNPLSRIGQVWATRLPATTPMPTAAPTATPGSLPVSDAEAPEGNSQPVSEGQASEQRSSAVPVGQVSEETLVGGAGSPSDSNTGPVENAGASEDPEMTRNLTHPDSSSSVELDPSVSGSHQSGRGVAVPRAHGSGTDAEAAVDAASGMSAMPEHDPEHHLSAHMDQGSGLSVSEGQDIQQPADSDDQAEPMKTPHTVSPVRDAQVGANIDRAPSPTSPVVSPERVASPSAEQTLPSDSLQLARRSSNVSTDTEVSSTALTLPEYSRELFPERPTFLDNILDGPDAVGEDEKPAAQPSAEPETATTQHAHVPPGATSAAHPASEKPSNTQGASERPSTRFPVRTGTEVTGRPASSQSTGQRPGHSAGGDPGVWRGAGGGAEQDSQSSSTQRTPPSGGQEVDGKPLTAGTAGTGEQPGVDAPPKAEESVTADVTDSSTESAAVGPACAVAGAAKHRSSGASTTEEETSRSDPDGSVCSHQPSSWSVVTPVPAYHPNFLAVLFEYVVFEQRQLTTDGWILARRRGGPRSHSQSFRVSHSPQPARSTPTHSTLGAPQRRHPQIPMPQRPSPSLSTASPEEDPQLLRHPPINPSQPSPGVTEHKSLLSTVFSPSPPPRQLPTHHKVASRLREMMRYLHLLCELAELSEQQLPTQLKQRLQTGGGGPAGASAQTVQQSMALGLCMDTLWLAGVCYALCDFTPTPAYPPLTPPKQSPLLALREAFVRNFLVPVARRARQLWTRLRDAQRIRQDDRSFRVWAGLPLEPLQQSGAGADHPLLSAGGPRFMGRSALEMWAVQFAGQGARFEDLQQESEAVDEYARAAQCLKVRDFLARMPLSAS